MKLVATIQWTIAVLIVTALTSCEKNRTVFYEDDDAKDLSVFSDQGTNVMSCYINGTSFRTRNRIARFGFFAQRDDLEVGLYKTIDTVATNSDTLTITWQNDALSPRPNSVSLVLAVKKEFSFDDFNAFNGTRLAIDGVNGYFMVNGIRSERGTGYIYFHRALLVPNDSAGDRGILSGVFEAVLPSYKITRGRFDHTLPVGNPDGVVFF